MYERFPTQFQHAANLYHGAIETALKLIPVTSDDPTVSEVAANLGENFAIGYPQFDPNFNIPRIIRPTGEEGGLTVHVIDDGDPVLRTYPYMRELPSYVQQLDMITLPVESFSSSFILSSLLVHEGTHRRDLNAASHHIKAAEIFPGATQEDASTVLTEVNAFTAEGRFLLSALGVEFADYFQEEVDVTDKAAIANQEENKGLYIEFGLDVSRIIEAIGKQVSFRSKPAEDFTAGLLNIALTTYGGLSVVDQLCDRNNVPDDTRIEMKASTLDTSYFY